MIFFGIREKISMRIKAGNKKSNCLANALEPLPDFAAAIL